ncbi:hypothetical protein NHX12_004952 [Muraenolepis orangiensis]|uniref:CCN family member 1 n=1 Tax=Muraenolepis orangiensis TaxID=630683 RepID=A0A9Q0DW97_9TELE|nr:hypothetical protein NHX12_004952 [Muraenolepis orangiensis]
MWVLASVAVIVCGLFKSVSPCPRECRCSAAAPRCGPGVSLVVTDRHCGCCAVCARQLNEDCGGTRPCDHTRGLTCNFGAGHGAAHGGICRAKSEGRSCEYNGRIYQNGESFGPNCRHRCTCEDGAVACVSLCPRKVTLPKQGCERHRLVRAPGRCCEQLACSDAGGKRWRLLVDEGAGGPRETLRSTNDLGYDEDVVSMGAFSSLAAFTREAEGQLLVFGPRSCQPQSSDWSPCSETCGGGVSTRLSNNNLQCKLTRETRLCEQGAGECDAKAAGRPVKLSHMGCGSLKKFQLRFCGSCPGGLCCRPHRTRTVPAVFRCEDGRTFSQNVMVIQSCRCEADLARASSDGGPLASLRHSNAIH